MWNNIRMAGVYLMILAIVLVFLIGHYLYLMVRFVWESAHAR